MHARTLPYESARLIQPRGDGAAMAEAGGAFVTRAFERMLKDSAGRKYGALQTALKAYLGELSALAIRFVFFPFLVP